MIGAILRTEDGHFAYGPAFGAVLFIGLTIGYLSVLYGALTKGRIPFGVTGTYSDSKICWFERDKNPGWFWFAFSVFTLMIPLCVWGAYALCTGFFQKSG